MVDNTVDFSFKINEKKWSELSELEALQTIVLQNKTIIEKQRGIKGWVTFTGVVLLIGLILSIILAFL